MALAVPVPGRRERERLPEFGQQDGNNNADHGGAPVNYSQPLIATIIV